jgi:hypothetical protein
MKTKRALIISSAIMVLVLIVTIVSVSAAWFGDIKHAETANKALHVSSQRPMGEATIDLTSAESLNEGTANLIPAEIKVDANGISWLLAGNAPAPNGGDLRPADGSTNNRNSIKAAASSAISKSATVPEIFFPFNYSGTPDSGVPDGKKAIRIYIDTAKIKLGTRQVGDKEEAILDETEFIDEFYITFNVVRNVTKNPETGVITYSNATSATATKNGSGEITFEGLSSMDDSIYFVNDITHSTLYLLSPPDIDVYSVQVQISYKYADEELNPRTVSKTIVFGVHIQVIEREVLLEAISPLVPTA